MERTKYIPSIVSLLGGLIACIFTMLNPYETYEIFLFVFLSTKIINSQLLIQNLDFLLIAFSRLSVTKVDMCGVQVTVEFFLLT